VFDFQHAAALLQIILFDLLLSGDNAVVIGMAARRLSDQNRRRAIIIGGAGAVGLRIAFTLVATYLLDVPLLQAVGGIMLLWIAAKLMRNEAHEEQVSEADSLGQAIRTIIIADVVMSLDNILAISSAADGHRGLVLFGLALSIPLLLVGSNVVSGLLNRFPILIYLGAVLLVWAAIRMIAEDKLVHDRVKLDTAVVLAITFVLSLVIILRGRHVARRTVVVHQGAIIPEPGEAHPQ
jgi:YjbE family integral membrane protein